VYASCETDDVAFPNLSHFEPFERSHVGAVVNDDDDDLQREIEARHASRKRMMTISSVLPYSIKESAMPCSQQREQAVGLLAEGLVKILAA
jgi:hypothetical protein